MADPASPVIPVTSAPVHSVVTSRRLIDPLERLALRKRIEDMEAMISLASDDYAARRSKLRRYLRWLSQACRRTETRVAPATVNLLAPEHEVELQKFIAAGFNTVVLNDVSSINTTTRTYTRLSEEVIATSLAAARKKNLSVIIGLGASPFTVSVGTPVIKSTALTPTQVAARIAIYSTHNEGEITGVYMLHDDVFLEKVAVATQLGWYFAVKQVTTNIPVYGIIGEFGANASENDMAAHYDRDAFDHLVFLMYPYNLGYVWKSIFNNAEQSHNIVNTVVDPDDQLRYYIDNYIAVMNARFFSGLKKRQTILPTIQAFNYLGEPAGKLVRPDDVQIQMEYTSDVIRATVTSQENNYAMGVFYWGLDPMAPYGLTSKIEWIEAARRANRHLRELAMCADHETCSMAYEVFDDGGIQ